MTDTTTTTERLDPELFAQIRQIQIRTQHLVTAALAGQYESAFKGRGMEFEEVRAYQPGDPIRHIDWKVTARMRRPHTRIYSEERNRPALVLVDQRVNMFFGSQHYMKSVTAAHAAALVVWRVLSQGDQPGAIVFSDEDQVEIRPARSDVHAMSIFRAIEKMNQSLRANDGRKSQPAQLGRILRHADRLAAHDHLVVLISDLDGLDDETRPQLNRLTQHNDVVVLLVNDPLERSLPQTDLLVVSDGELQLEVDARRASLRKQFAEAFQEKVESGRLELHKRNIPMLPIGTDEPVVGQLASLFGALPAMRRP